MWKNERNVTKRKKIAKQKIFSSWKEKKGRILLKKHLCVSF